MHTLGKMVSPMEKTQSPAERFYESIYYSDESLEEDYLAELRNFSSDHWDTALRAARLSAAIADLYRSDAERYWNSTLATIERVKHTYRAKIRNS